MADASGSDRRIGATITLGAVATAGALAMFVGHGSAMARGGGFATAVVAGSLLVAALHAYT